MISAKQRDALADALENEHPCHDNSCDIRAAMEHGFYLWAGHLLTGATECPETEAAFLAINPSREELDKECEELLESVPHLKCKSCNAICWDAEPGQACGNCLAPLPDTYMQKFDRVVCEEEGCLRKRWHDGDHDNGEGVTWGDDEDE